MWRCSTLSESIFIIDWELVYRHMQELDNSALFISLIVLIVVDVITGKFKALKLGVIDSSIGTSGIMKHTTIILLTVLVFLVSRIIGMAEIGHIFKVFYILEYTTSILENLEALGIPFPDSFTRYFNRMRTDYDKKVIDENKE